MSASAESPATAPPESAAGAPSRRTVWSDVAALLTVGALALVFGGGRILLRPDLLFTEEYVVGEHGNPLYRAERLAQGQMLYRDVACQYGPLPIYLYAAYTLAVGNTIAASICWHLGGSVASLTLAYLVFRRRLAVGFALAGTVAALPLLLAPGGADLGGGYGNFLYVEYLALERCCLLGIMLLWEPPAIRSRGRSVGIGLLLGLWQLIKFGGAFFGGAAVAAVDLLVLWGTPELRKTVRSWGWLFGTFAIVEAAQVALAFALLPPELAADTVWPAYVRVSYAHLASWPALNGAYSFLADQLLPLSCALMAAAVLGRFVVRLLPPERVTVADRQDAVFLIGALFYALAATAYLGHPNLFYQYAWVLLFPAVWAVVRVWPELRRIGVVLVAIPLVLMAWTTFVAKAPPDLIDYPLPDGEHLWLTPGARDGLESFTSATRAGPLGPNDFVVAVRDWSSGGFHHFYNRAYGLRNYMVDVGAFRPYDEAELSAKLGKVKAFVMLASDPKDAEQRIRRVFSRKLASRILDRFSLEGDQITNGVAVYIPRTEGVAQELERPHRFELPGPYQGLLEGGNLELRVARREKQRAVE